MKTSIKPGEVLDLNVECEGGSLYIGAWVDWNGNGSFDEAGEFIGYLPKGTIKVSIPDEAVVVPGERRLRIIASYEDILSACGQYGYGETEDYTLVVEHSDNSPIIIPGLSIIDSYQSFDVRPVTLEIKNEGSAELTGTASVLYALPHSPGSKQPAFATKIANLLGNLQSLRNPIRLKRKKPSRRQNSYCAMTTGSKAKYRSAVVLRPCMHSIFRAICLPDCRVCKSVVSMYI